MLQHRQTLYCLYVNKSPLISGLQLNEYPEAINYDFMKQGLVLQLVRNFEGRNKSCQVAENDRYLHNLCSSETVYSGYLGVQILLKFSVTREYGLKELHT